MLFLKKFYAYGFKSFADEIKIDFVDEMTGIVGPNGAGKSNIVDAFKWVLGEQSVKDMRGSNKLDLIFKGSSSRPESNFAQVTLTFDNSNKFLHYDKDEISITRKLFRDSGNNEYFINNEPARLKDIQLIFTDTGLSKGSLGIISQGTVNSFSEAKPEARRKMFEEAAGIGMYSIQKAESLRHLEKAEQSLTTIVALEKELERDLKKLVKQAENAKIWKEKFDKLKDLEISILVRDISHFNVVKTKTEEEVKMNENESRLKQPLENELKQKLDFIKSRLNDADLDVTKSNEELFKINEQIATLEKKQAIFSSKLLDGINSSNEQDKIKAYEQLIISHKKDISSLTERINELKGQVEVFEDVTNDLALKKNKTYEEINNLNILFTERATRLRIINEQIERNSNQSFGVKTVLENKLALKGVYDIVSKFINVEERYEVAISKALGKSGENIIVETSENAKNAVNFLKQNNGGTATFLPLRDIKSKFVRQEHLDVLTELEGFIGIASKLINVDPKMQVVIDALIGQVIISNTIEDAIRISKYTYQLYKVISLDGDVVFPGGAITGGSNREIISQFNLEKHKEELEVEIKDIESKLLETKLEYEKISAEHTEVDIKVNEKKYAISNLSNNLENTQKNYDKYLIEYETLTRKSFDSNKVIDENNIQDEINNLISKKAKIQESLTIATTNKINYSSQLKDIEANLEEVRISLDRIKAALAQSNQNLIRCQNSYDNAKNRINEIYGMTLEFAVENYSKELPMSEAQAKEIINQLRAEIDALGTINPKAVEELTEKQEKYDLIVENRKQTEDSVNNIKVSISELDKAAKSKFAKIINDVNNELPNIFKFLFGGGSCVVTCSDPNNILESGIEVMAHPPGKRISNLKLLSGGEKTLVAIAVLFAILKISSFPIVILDEAEAALDIANVERFAQIIRQNANQTQFLVITHRPGTMKECKTLLGVTMQNPGISNIFSVSIDKAIKFAKEEK